MSYGGLREGIIIDLQGVERIPGWGGRLWLFGGWS